MKNNSYETINNIINNNRNYAKKSNNLNTLIIIFEENISIKDLIYIDDISRIILLESSVEINYFTNNIDKKKKGIIEKYRININNYINYEIDEQNIENTLNNIRKNQNCQIKNNCLYLNNNIMINSLGDYSKILTKISYIYSQSQIYDRIIIVDNTPEYKDNLEELNIYNYHFYNLLSNTELNLEESIDKVRLNAISCNLDLDQINDLNLNINKHINNSKIKIIDENNSLNSIVENNILNLLNEYTIIVLDISNSLNINNLLLYLIKIIEITKEYLNIIEESPTEEQITLLKSVKIIINNILELFGIITIY